jgi:hypothetical protein
VTAASAAVSLGVDWDDCRAKVSNRWVMAAAMLV